MFCEINDDNDDDDDDDDDDMCNASILQPGRYGYQTAPVPLLS